MGGSEGMSAVSSEPPVGSIVATEADLAALYREPSRLVATKKAPRIDEASRAFIAASPFCLVATAGRDGGLDVSPRGGPPGFVRVIDDRHLAIPDLNGNNLIDTLRAVVATGRAGLLVVVPGKDETVRVNGVAWVTTDATVLDRWDGELRRPTTAIVVRADEVFMHCAKAFRRGRVWDPRSWTELAAAPDGVEVLGAQGLVPRVDQELRTVLEAGYAADLAADTPEV